MLGDSAVNRTDEAPAHRPCILNYKCRGEQEAVNWCNRRRSDLNLRPKNEKQLLSCRAGGAGIPVKGACVC